MINLNIGGSLSVSVPRSTLTQFDDSMLAAWFSGRFKLVTDGAGKVCVR